MFGCRYNPAVETLEYDYTKVSTGANGETRKPNQKPPRIRLKGEYYVDSFNGDPWVCSFGTSEEVCNCFVFILNQF